VPLVIYNYNNLRKNRLIEDVLKFGSPPLVVSVCFWGPYYVFVKRKIYIVT
jgi:hypothetical protein